MNEKEEKRKDEKDEDLHTVFIGGKPFNTC